jgi:hypothetical protein
MRLGLKPSPTNDRVIKKAHPKLDAFQAHPAAKSVMANWPNMGGTTIAAHLSRLITGG